VLSIASTQNAVDYATEKLLDPPEHDSVIPIYLGPPNERDFLPHPSAATLIRDFSAEGEGADVDEETMRRVARHVVAISQNATVMQQLQSWSTELVDRGFRSDSGRKKISKDMTLSRSSSARGSRSDASFAICARAMRQRGSGSPVMTTDELL
jgi:hypothetical protein